MSYLCPTCDGKTRVVDSRAEVRKRRCTSCGKVFRTYETEIENPREAVASPIRPKGPPAKVKTRRRLWQGRHVVELVRMVNEGMTVEQIAAELHRKYITPNAVRGKLFRMGLIPLTANIRVGR